MHARLPAVAGGLEGIEDLTLPPPGAPPDSKRACHPFARRPTQKKPSVNSGASSGSPQALPVFFDFALMFFRELGGINNDSHYLL
jgi:hypothetical protein